MNASRPSSASARTLTPRQLAEAIGVSESSVKRWVDDGHILAARTAGGHRRIALADAVRYIRERRVAVVRPDLLGLVASPAGAPAAASDPDEPAARFFDYLRAGAAAEARGLLITRYLEGASVAEIVDGVLAPAMARVGELWVEHPSGIFWEHRATQIAVEALAELRRLLAAPAGAPAAVGGAPAGDPYLLPSLAVAAVLEGEGLSATNLGPETPVEALALSIDELDARLAWVSVSVAPDPARLRRELAELATRLAERGTMLVVGGSAAPKLTLPHGSAIYVGRSMVELEALVRGMRLMPVAAASR